MSVKPLDLVPAGHSEVLSTDQGSVVARSILPGGVRVLTESMPGQRSVSIGFWVGVGSRDEVEGQHGSTHFLEHLLFKGTKRRSAMDIAAAFDEVGGESNAATAKETTCYYARVLDTDLPMAVDVISDMVTSAVIDPVELENERGVILEEIAMDHDDPTDVVHERFAEAVLPGHELGRPIGGTPEAITNVPRESVWDHYQRHYRPEGLVVTAAGGIDHEQVCALVLDALRTAGWELDGKASPTARRSTAPAGIVPTASVDVVNRPVEQANVLIGTTALNSTDERRYPMMVLNSILGGGMSSRLFQEVREKRGLAYSVYSFSVAYADAGYFGMYAGCSPAKVAEVVGLMKDELAKMAAEGVTEAELAKAKGQLSGGLVLSQEDTGSRMSRLGGAELGYGRYLDVEETLARIRAVKAEEVRELARMLSGQPQTLTIVGPFEKDDEFRSLVGL